MSNFLLWLLWLLGLALVMYPLYYTVVRLLCHYGLLPREWIRK